MYKKNLNQIKVELFVVLIAFCIGITNLAGIIDIGSSASSTHYVNSTLNDGKYDTISEAIENAESEDIIIVEWGINGIYVEDEVSIPFHKQLKIVGNDTGEKITIDGNGSSVAIEIYSDYSNISNFHVKNSGIGIEIGSDVAYVDIWQCKITEFTTGVYLNQAISPLLKDVEIDGGDSSTHGVEINGCNTPHISYCRIYNNGGTARKHGGIYIHSTTNDADINYCDIEYNYYGIYIETSYNAWIDHNIISWSDYEGVRDDGGHDNQIRFNDIDNNTGYGVYFNNLTEDNLVRDNDFTNNQDGGIQGYDDTENGNEWYETGNGNFWLDWGGEGYYYITGDKEEDRAPEPPEEVTDAGYGSGP